MRMIGLVGVPGGAPGAINALDGLRMLGRAPHAWVIPERTSVPEIRRAFGATGHPNDPELERRLKEVGRNVARFADLLTSKRGRGSLDAREGVVTPAVGV